MQSLTRVGSYSQIRPSGHASFPFFFTLRATSTSMRQTNERKLLYLQEKQQELRGGLTGYVHLPKWILLQAASRLSTARTASRDGITVDAIRALPANFRERFRQAFEGRISNVWPHTDSVEQWETILASGIPKPGQTDFTQLPKHRWIGKISTMLQWYETVLDIITCLRTTPLHPCIRAYRPGAQITDITETTRLLDHKAFSWGVPWICIDGDIEAANDNANLNDVDNAYADRQLCIPLLLAAHRERANHGLRPRCGPYDIQPVNWSNGIVQGGPKRGNDFNTVLHPV